VEILMDKDIDYDEETKVPGYSKFTCTRGGDVYSYMTGVRKIVSQNDRSGYNHVSVTSDSGKRSRVGTHRVVAMTYLPNPLNLPFVNHKDGNRRNNIDNNLEWITPSDNTKHSHQVLGARTTTRKVVHATLDGTLIAEYDSIIYASSQTGVGITLICSICRGTRIKYQGTTWHYAENFKGQPVAIKKTRAAIVRRYDKNMKLLEETNGVNLTAKAIKADPASITRAARNNTLFRGFYWKCEIYKPQVKVVKEDVASKTWKKLPEFPLYRISRDGSAIYSERSKINMNLVVIDGYSIAKIRNKSGKTKVMRMHRLVALAYIPNPKRLPVVNHKNGNKLDNSVENLEWCSYTHNALHAYASGLKTPPYRRIYLLSDDSSEILEEYKSLKEAVQNAQFGLTKMRRILKGDITIEGENYTYAPR